ncbi:hypothetical protein [Halobaculum lipolyticum]|uniref:Uncharacterized protein n=1 Tax=Halobaculum lipolyticum TaxID=3032001 RepID=A0ABD5WDW2_9EURY|nr:hypothetical protein [Halobaculum sp. DT31]
MRRECSIWRSCTGDDAVARVSDASPPRSFRNRSACRACVDAMRADPTVDLVVEERYTPQAV